MRKVLFVLFLMTMSVPAQAQTDKKQEVWQPLKFFVGSWEGTSKGQFGEATLEREYRFVLNGTFLEVKGKSVYKPQEKNPKGEVHEEMGLISFDRGRKKFVFRQFHVEGFVNQYVVDSIEPGGKTIKFDTESIENIAPGWRARETYKILGNDEFVEVFELAAPGKDFQVYVENSFKRKR